MNLIDPAIADFYSESAEDSRLKFGLGPLEFERNKLLIGRHLRGSNLKVADIGGGSGHYAQWMAALGHQVTLVDPVEKLVAKARQKAKKTAFQCILGEARKLPLETASTDLAVLHGPLYHILESQERINALTEAARILKPGGILLGFAITRAASAIAALQGGMIRMPEVYEMCKAELKTGMHRPPAGMPGMLAPAHFHRPSELLEEACAAGFTSTKLYAVEGMVWMDGQYFQSWADPQQRQRLLELVGLTEDDQDLLCFSPHMMVAAVKP